MLNAAALAAAAAIGYWALGGRAHQTIRASQATRNAHLLFAALALIFLARAWQPATVVGPIGLYARHYPWKGIAAPAATPPAANNATLTDVAFYFYPWHTEVQRQLRAGQLPLWSEGQFSGAPLAANMSSAVYFPLTWLLLFVSVSSYLAIAAALKIYLAGMGVYLLAREIGADGVGAALAGIAFALGGFMNAFLLYAMTAALALTPWILVAALRLARCPQQEWRRDWRERRKWIAALAILFALQILSGHPETVFYAGLMVLIVWLFVVPPWRAGSARVWLAGAFAVLLANALAAPQTLPFVEYANRSARRAQFERQPQLSDVPAAKLAAQMPLLLLPDYHGNPVDENYSGPFQYNATPGYVGMAALLLAPLGLRRNKHAGWLVALLLFSAAFTFRLPGFYDAALRLPVFAEIAHHRWIFGISLALALLAGLGLTRWRRGEAEPAALAVSAGVLVIGVALLTPWGAEATAAFARYAIGRSTFALAALGLSAALVVASRRPRWAVAASSGLLLLAAADLTLLHQRYLPVAPAAALFPPSPLLTALAERWRPGDRLVATGEVLRPNTSMALGFADVRGEDAVKLEAYERALSTAGNYDAFYFRPLRQPDAPVVEFLGGKWILTDPDTNLPAVEQVYAGADGHLYRNQRARGFWTPAAGAAIPRSFRELAAARRGEVSDLAVAPGRISGMVASPAGGWLVDAHAHYPGWTCEIDGVRTAFEPALGAFRAARLAAGTHRVVMRYRPASTLWGFVLCGVALVVVSALWQSAERRVTQ